MQLHRVIIVGPQQDGGHHDFNYLVILCTCRLDEVLCHENMISGKRLEFGGKTVRVSSLGKSKVKSNCRRMKAEGNLRNSLFANGAYPLIVCRQYIGNDCTCRRWGQRMLLMSLFQRLLEQPHFLPVGQTRYSPSDQKQDSPDRQETCDPVSG